MMKRKISTRQLAWLLLCMSFCVSSTNLIAAPPVRENSVALKRHFFQRITGTVKDAEGNPLSGATVQEKGTNNATQTDGKGGFVINIKDGATLIISHVGYESVEKTPESEAELHVVLQRKDDATTEVEVVVTALGIRKDKRVLGFATQDVKGEAMVKAREPQVISGLTGRVAGLTITNKSSLFEDAVISLRGKKPLVVIDGIPTQGDFWNLNPDDIENINVLKSNAAALLYGNLGVDGALLVTTKKGKSGANGVEVSLNQSIQASAGWLKLPEYQTQYGMGWNGFYGFVDGNGGGGWYDNYGYVWGPKLDVKNPNTASGYEEYPQYNSPYDPDQLFEFQQKGSTGQSHYKPMPWISRGTKNLQNFMQRELLYTINANISGKSDISNYRISLNHAYQRGQIPNTKLNSTTLALSGDLKLSSKLKVEGTLSYNRQVSPNYPDNGYGANNFFYNLLLWMGADVDVRDMKNYWQPGKENVQQLTYNYAWYNNPWYLAKERLREYRNDVIVASTRLTYDITSDLNFMIRSGGTFNHKEREVKTPYSYIYYSASPFGNYYIDGEHKLLIQSDALLTYKRKWNSFDLTVAGGAANRYERYAFDNANTTGGLQVPNVYNLASSRDPVVASNSKWEKETNSIFAYTDMGYKNLLNLNISVRNDWSSAFQKPYNSFFYPSASLSFILSEAVQLPKFISFTKLRAAYADVRSEVGAYYTLPTYVPGVRWNGQPSLNLPGVILDSAIRPKRTISREVGIETKFLNNRLGLDVTYYSYLDKDSPREIPQSMASGYPSLVVNGDVYNRRGLEVVVNAALVQKKNFGWDMMLNYSRIRNYVKELYGGVQSRGLLQVGDRINVDTDPGGKWGGALLYTGYKWEKSPDGQIVYSDNGMPQYLNQLVNLGVHEHDWDFGINNAFRYKQFSFSFLFDGRIGGNIWNGVEAKMYESGAHKNTANQYRDDSYAGKKTYVGNGVVVTSGAITYDAFGNITSDTRQFAPNTKAVDYVDWVFAHYTTGVTEALRYDQTFVKLREIIFGYNFKPVSLKKTPFTAASISLVGRNLFLFTKVPFMDPEAYSNLTMAEPTYRNVGININLKF